MGSRSNQSHWTSLHTHVDLIGYAFLQQSICNAAVGLWGISFFCRMGQWPGGSCSLVLLGQQLQFFFFSLYDSQYNYCQVSVVHGSKP